MKRAHQVLGPSGLQIIRDAEAYFVLAMAQSRLTNQPAASAALAAGTDIVKNKLPRLESQDLGALWDDVILANALMREALTVVNGAPAKVGASPVTK